MQTKVKIKGYDWTVKLLTPKQYAKEAAKDEVYGSAAYTTVDGSRKIVLQKGGTTIGIIRHEISHAIVSEAPVLSAELSPHQIEEMMCEIIQKDWGLISKLTEEIVDSFL